MDRRQNRNRAMLTEPIAVTLLVVDTLEDLGVPYFIGGSLATAVHGVARATMNVDIVFDQTQFRRREVNTLAQDPARTAYVASPEDNILAKLVWFRKGGEVSDRQWQDIVNVLRIQGDRLDLSYLREWAARLGVTDLLKRALGAVDIE